MQRERIKAAYEEALRFIAKVDALPGPKPYEWQGRQYTNDNYPKEQGAIRRASMDLTRALAEMRKP